MIWSSINLDVYVVYYIWLPSMFLSVLLSIYQSNRYWSQAHVKDWAKCKEMETYYFEISFCPLPK